MKASEKDQLRKALRHLAADPCEWDEAMAILRPLAGLPHRNIELEPGRAVNPVQAAAEAERQKRTSP